MRISLLIGWKYQDGQGAMLNQMLDRKNVLIVETTTAVS